MIGPFVKEKFGWLDSDLCFFRSDSVTCYPATWSPWGLWQRLAAALTGHGPAFTGISLSYPRTTVSVIVGVSQELLLPKSSRKAKEDHEPTKEKHPREEPPSLYSSIPSPPGSATSAASSTPPSPMAVGSTSSGTPQGPPPPRSLRGGGEDFHPLAACRAILLAAQVSALAPWGPPQFAHLAVPCGHRRPLPS